MHSINNVESAESANSAVRCSKQTQLNCQSLISAKSYHSLKSLSAHEGLVTHAQKVVMNILIFQVSTQQLHFPWLFQTFPYLRSFSMIFQTWKISTLNSMTFQTFPGSVRTLVKFHFGPIAPTFAVLISSTGIQFQGYPSSGQGAIIFGQLENCDFRLKSPCVAGVA